MVLLVVVECVVTQPVVLVETVGIRLVVLRKVVVGGVVPVLLKETVKRAALKVGSSVVTCLRKSSADEVVTIGPVAGVIARAVSFQKTSR